MLIRDSLKTIALSLITLSLIGIAYAWTEPTQTPPNDNTLAPINVSDTNQAKSGALQVNGFRNVGGTILDDKVGIGMPTDPITKIPVEMPKNKLDVEGGAVIGATYSGTNTAPNNGIIIEGNVGIGTTTPTQKLDVAGYVKGQTGLCIGNDCRTSWPTGFITGNFYGYIVESLFSSCYACIYASSPGYCITYNICGTRGKYAACESGFTPQLLGTSSSRVYYVCRKN